MWLLVAVFAAFVAFLAKAPEPLKQITLAALWTAGAIGALWGAASALY